MSDELRFPVPSTVLSIDPAATAFVTTNDAARPVDARPASLLDRLAAQHGRRRRLREMERRAGCLADALEEAARCLRRNCPVHPPVERLVPPGGVSQFASELRDLFLEVRREDDAIDAELDRLDRLGRRTRTET